MSVDRRTAKIAIKLATTVNKTSQGTFPPLSEEDGGAKASAFIVTFFLGSSFGRAFLSLPDSATGVETRLPLVLFFDLATLGAELIVVEPNGEAGKLSTCQIR